MKKVIVACGGAVATSTVAANKIRELAKREGIPVEVTQCRVNELDSKKDGIDLIVTTARVKKGLWRSSHSWSCICLWSEHSSDRRKDFRRFKKIKDRGE